MEKKLTYIPNAVVVQTSPTLVVKFIDGQTFDFGVLGVGHSVGQQIFVA